MKKNAKLYYIILYYIIEMKIDYYSKYLKYKAKYLELKRQIGGGG